LSINGLSGFLSRVRKSHLIRLSIGWGNLWMEEREEEEREEERERMEEREREEEISKSSVRGEGKC
jgi:hypothetical protein